MADKKTDQLKDKDLAHAQGGKISLEEVTFTVKGKPPKPGHSSVLESMAEDESGT